MAVSTDEIIRAVQDARNFRHPYRSMRVTLECGHLRLMPEIGTVQGIGSYTACKICPPPEGQPHYSRLVVNVEETGVLDSEAWLKAVGGE